METKKVKKSRLNFKRLLILILVVYLFGYGVYYLFKEPIRNIVISGNVLINDADIISAGGLKGYPSMLAVNNRAIAKKIKKLTLVEDVKIKKDFHFRLHIEIVESKILFIHNTNGQLMLSNGEYTENKFDVLGIPSLINYAPKNVLYEFSLAFGVVDYGIIGLISEIEYSPSVGEDGTTIDETRFIIYMNDGNIIYTNTAKVENLQHYREIFASLADRKGILYLDSGNHRNFLFMPFENLVEVDEE